jgi:hypothetical protein
VDTSIIYIISDAPRYLEMMVDRSLRSNLKGCDRSKDSKLVAVDHWQGGSNEIGNGPNSDGGLVTCQWGQNG